MSKNVQAAERKLAKDVRRMERMKARIARIDFLLKRGGRPDVDELKQERERREDEVKFLRGRIEQARKGGAGIRNTA